MLAGLITGTAVTFAWEYSPTLEPLLYELIPAFAAGLVATVAVSLVTQPLPGADRLMASMERPSPYDR